MGKRADIQILQTSTNGINTGAGSYYLIQTASGVLYWVFLDFLGQIAFKKSSDGGLTWSNFTSIKTAVTFTQMSVWYDRWSGIAAGLIHIAYTDTSAHDTFYRTIDTENSDTLSTETVIFSGVSAVAAGSSISICRSRGGNVYCRVCIDAGAEGGFFRLPNANVPNGAWDAARSVNEALATLDMGILLPGFAADNQDMILIFWDASANEVSRQLYDDSANTWSETSIQTSMVDVAASSGYPQFAAAVDITNSRIILIAWNGVDTSNADLLCWTVTDSTITAKTDVVTNSTDDQGICSISIDLQTGYWWAFYAGKSDGSETYSSALNMYCKVSQDSGTTWGAETLLTSLTNAILGIYACPRLNIGPQPIIWVDGATLRTHKINVDVSLPVARYKLGVY